MTFTDRRGNLLDDDADVLVCTTNAVGAMGKGIALAFAKRWPSIVAPYALDCKAGRLRGGSVKLYDLPEAQDLFSRRSPRSWAAFCTKHDWKKQSEYAWVQAGLETLSRLLVEGGHHSVAIPPLGCGLGGLDWRRVRPMIEAAFEGQPIDVRLYVP